MDEFDLVVESYKAAAQDVGRQFENATDDWHPMLFLHTDDDKVQIVALSMADDNEKMLLTKFVIPSIIQTSGASFAALVISAWQSSQPRPEVLPETWDDLPIRPSQDPNRTEVLQIMAASEGRLEYWVAPILRDDEHPPGLGEWEKYDDSNNLVGRFPDALRRGFQK